MSVKNILATLSQRVEEHPDKIAFAFRKKDSNEISYDEISYSDLDKKSSKVANYLSQRGFHHGLITLVIIRPNIDFIILLYGMIKSGSVPLLIPNLNLKNSYDRRQLRAILNRAKPRGIIGFRKSLFISWILRFSRKCDMSINMKHLKSYYTNTNNDSIFNLEDGKNWEEAPAFVKYTTGTTGPAKGVVYNHGMLHAHLRLLKSQGMNKEEVFFGRSGTLIVHPLLGITSIVNTSKPRQTTGQNIVDEINQWKASSAFLSPPSAINLAKFLDLQTNDKCQNMPILPSLKRLYVGGESVSAKIVQLIEPHFSKHRPAEGGFHLVYGATEGFPLCQVQTKMIIDTESETNSGGGICVGRAVDDIRIKILTFEDDSGLFDSSSAVEVSGTGVSSLGEISVQGSAVYSNLIGEDETKFGGSISWATDVLNKNSWHRTGDLGYKDELDRIWLVGRKAHKVRLIDGNTLYTKQVEQFLDSSLNIRTALVNGPSNLKPVIVVEKQEQDWIILDAKLRQKIPKLCEIFNIDSDFIFIQYDNEFPVDSGHEAKIEREKLSDWAKTKIHIKNRKV